MRQHRKRSLEGCAAQMQRGRHPSRLAEEGEHLRVTVMD